MAVDVFRAHHRQPDMAQCRMLCLFHHRKENRKMNNPSRVGITKLDASLVDKRHDATMDVPTEMLRKPNCRAHLAAGRSVLFADEWHQSHETCSFNRSRNSVLADSRATAFTTANDLSVAVDQLGQQFNVLVIDVHRTRAMAIDKNRVFSLRS